MNSRKLTLMAALVIVLIVSVFWIVGKRDSATAAAESGALLFPELADTINDIETVVVESGSERFTLSRDGADWQMIERDGYPVDSAKVRKLLIALNDATILEGKTSKPANYARLGVQDIGTPGETASTRVTAKNAGGDALAALIVGNPRRSQGGGAAAYFVRRDGEAQSLLVEGALAVQSAQSDWLDKNVIDVAAADIVAVRVEHADGEVLLATRPTGIGSDLELQDIPEGMEARYARAADSAATGLARMTFDDVKSADEVSFDDPPLSTCTFWLADGLKITVVSHETEDAAFYARITAEHSAESAPNVSLPEGTPAPDAAAAEARAAEITARTAGWVYRFPTWKQGTFTKRAADILKEIEPEPEPGPVGDAPGAPPADGGTPVIIEPPIPADGDEGPPSDG